MANVIQLYCITIHAGVVRISSRNDGVIDPDLLEKIMVSGRVPKYVKKYAEAHEITISQLLMAGFDVYREKDAKHASERLSYHENRVLHWRRIVLHNDESCNTKVAFCNTVRDEFKKQGRGHQYNKRMDKNWLLPRVKKAVEQGIVLTVNELYAFCVKEENNGGEK